MRIAILGIRGIPASYGGFETFAEELSTRLVERGHQVTVYGRSHNVHHTGGTYRGVGLVVLPTVRSKHLDTVVHTLLSVFHALGRRYDVVLMCNAVNAAFCVIPRLAGTPVALNVDGIERRRRKWGWAARGVYRVSERLATWIPTAVVTDARVIRDYFHSRYGTESVTIAYGANLHRPSTTEALHRLGLGSRNYLLYVSRLEPENNAHLVIDAYRAVQTPMPLVVVGDAPYAGRYIQQLKSAADSRVIFPGAIYGAGYHELRAHAYAYVQATEVGGTHPALLEAMGAGNCILAKDTPEHREVLEDTGLYFESAADLTAMLVRILEDAALVARLGGKARERAAAVYSWESITDQYEALFRELSSS